MLRCVGRAAIALGVPRIAASKSGVALRFAMGGHESAFALSAHDQALFCRQFINGTCRTVPWLTLKRAGQLHLAGDQFSGAPLASLQAVRVKAWCTCWYRGLRAAAATDAPPWEEAESLCFDGTLSAEKIIHRKKNCFGSPPALEGQASGFNNSYPS